MATHTKNRKRAKTEARIANTIERLNRGWRPYSDPRGVGTRNNVVAEIARRIEQAKREAA